MASGPDQSSHECGKALEHQFIEAGRCLYHPDCMKCRYCQTKLVLPNVYVINNVPYCQNHRGKEVGASAECPGCIKNSTSIKPKFASSKPKVATHHVKLIVHPVDGYHYDDVFIITAKEAQGTNAIGKE